MSENAVVVAMDVGNGNIAHEKAGSLDQPTNVIAATAFQSEGPFNTLSIPEDVANIYRLILGRSPESADIIARNATRKLDELIVQTLRSGEFAAIISQFENRPANLPHEVQLDENHYLAIKSWLSRRLQLNPPSELDKGVNWPALLSFFLSAWPMWHHFRTAYGPQRASAYFKNLVKVKDEEKQWSGSIDIATADMIKGWIANPKRLEPVRISFFANGTFIGMAENSEYRRDVQQAIGGSGICGFSFRPLLNDRLVNEPRLKITAVEAGAGGALPLEAHIQNNSTAAMSELISLQGEVVQLAKRISDLNNRLSCLDCLVTFPVSRYSRLADLYGTPAPLLDLDGKSLPKISIVVPVYRPPRRLLRGAIASIINQSYKNWELVLVSDAPDDEDTRAYLRRTAETDARIKFIDLQENNGLAGAINEGIAAISGDYVCLLDHDDEFDRHALAWCASIAATTRAKLIYSDEDRFEYSGNKKVFHSPYFKTAADYDLLLQRNYIRHIVCIDAGLWRAVGGMRKEFDGAQDHELAIRVFEALNPSEIVHIPLVLYHWHVTQTPHSNSAADIAAIEKRSRQAVQEHLERTGKVATVTAYRDGFASPIQFCNTVNWPAPIHGGKLAIVIPIRDRIEYLAPCIESIERSFTQKERCEIIIVNNRSESELTRQYLGMLKREGRVRIVDLDEEFNWSRANNIAVAAADAEYLLFMNNDMVVISPGLDETVIGLLSREDCGAVGARLLYENGTLQHAGVALGIYGIAGHVGTGEVAGDRGYFDLSNLVHRVSAVTGAFLAVSRETFEQAGGFDEENLKIAYNDVDFCLRVNALGKAVIYTPQITCYHYESASRGYDALDPVKAARAQSEAQFVRDRWGKVLQYDLFYNGMFDRNSRPYSMISMPSTENVMEYISMQAEPSAIQAVDTN